MSYADCYNCGAPTDHYGYCPWGHATDAEMAFEALEQDHYAGKVG